MLTKETHDIAKFGPIPLVGGKRDLDAALKGLHNSGARATIGPGHDWGMTDYEMSSHEDIVGSGRDTSTICVAQSSHGLIVKDAVAFAEVSGIHLTHNSPGIFSGDGVHNLIHVDPSQAIISDSLIGHSTIVDPHVSFKNMRLTEAQNVGICHKPGRGEASFYDIDIHQCYRGFIDAVGVYDLHLGDIYGCGSGDFGWKMDGTNIRISADCKICVTGRNPSIAGYTGDGLRLVNFGRMGKVRGSLDIQDTAGRLAYLDGVGSQLEINGEWGLVDLSFAGAAVPVDPNKACIEFGPNAKYNEIEAMISHPMYNATIRNPAQPVTVAKLNAGAEKNFGYITYIQEAGNPALGNAPGTLVNYQGSTALDNQRLDIWT